jgi:hypothetical protein
MHKLEVGDVVRIREWEDLMRRYPYDDEMEVIRVPYGFTGEMAYLCGVTCQIIEIKKPPDRENLYTLATENQTLHWSFSEEMFQLIDNESFKKLKELNIMSSNKIKEFDEGLL